MDQASCIKSKSGRLRGIGMIGMIAFGVVIVIGVMLLVQSSTAYAKGDASYDGLREQMQAGIEGNTAANDTQGSAVARGIPAECLAALGAENPDFCAWLWQEGTAIDYPVVLGGDNEYYLNHLFDGEKNKLGCLFMDCRNKGDFSDKNTVIYGHNMKNGSMFHSLTDYKDPVVYATRPTMTIYTPDETYMLELFAGAVVSGDAPSVKINFESEEAFMAYVDALKANSTFDSHVEVTPEDRLVTLCTCSYEYDNARYVLAGKLEESGE